MRISRFNAERNAMWDRTGLLVFIAIAQFFVGLCVSSSALSAEPKLVLTLHSFGREFKPWSEYAKAIRLELERQSPWPLDIQEHALVTARASESHPEIAFVEYLSALYSKRQPDLIVSIGAPAAAFVQRHRKLLFPNAPMVLTVVDQRRVQYSTLGPNDTVVAVAIDYHAAIENILQVLPDTNHIAGVIGTSPIEAFWKEEIEKESNPFKDRIKFTWYDSLSFEEILKHAADLPPGSAIFWELMIVDAAGIVHEEGKALQRLHAVANAPIFSYTDAFFGHGIVGGPHVPVLEAGQQVAAVALRILGGENAGNIKVPPVGMGPAKFDWRELQRWGISESLLPPGSHIFFRPPIAWEQYKIQIIIISVALLLQTILIFRLLYEHRLRRVAETQLLERADELAYMNRSATAGELSASIAHEVKQPLAAIVANASAALRWLGKQTPDIEEARLALNRMLNEGHRASQVIDEIRDMFRKNVHIREPVDVNALISETLLLVDHEIHTKKVLVQTALTQDKSSRIVADRIQLQQVFLNLVVNAIEAMQSLTSKPRILLVSTTPIDTPGLDITVEDSGPGIDPENAGKVFEMFFTTKPKGMGIGLAMCRSIVESHGGRIEVSRSRLGGCKFQVHLPNAG
jgi:signal transduction histidine kinase